MKLVVVIIKPGKLDYLTSALRRGGVSGATVTMAKGFGQENAVSDWNLTGELTEKVKVEVVVEDEQCDEVVDLIKKTIGTGKSGAGFLYIQPIIESLRNW